MLIHENQQKVAVETPQPSFKRRRYFLFHSQQLHSDYRVFDTTFAFQTETTAV